jgi:hypothetical protein
MQKWFIKSMLIARHACIEKAIIFSHIQNFVRFEVLVLEPLLFLFYCSPLNTDAPLNSQVSIFVA